jgi:surface antigen
MFVIMGDYIQRFISLFLQFIAKMQEFPKSELAQKTKTFFEKTKKHLSSFHALHSSLKMDRLDYTFKFSTELVVATLSLIIIGANVVGASRISSINNNLFSKLLSYHHDANAPLYAKTTTTSTIVANNPIIPSASAQVVLTSSENGDSNEYNPDESAIGDNTIEKPNPDSVRGMIADQIKVYDSVPGDTLESIAKKFNISVNTIIWANNLKDNNIKPGWNFVILPTSGVLHKVDRNDTLIDIANDYKVDVNKIISYNGLQDVNDINPGDLIIIPDGVVTPPPVKAAAPIKHVVKGKTVYEPAVQRGGSHSFPWGQCTYWAALKVGGVPWGGNANQWSNNARAMGYRVDRVPTVGAIMQTRENRRYGHVVYITAVNGDEVTFSEMNYAGLGKVTTRTLDIDSSLIVGVIHI